MIESELQIKLSYITGLKEVVIDEIKENLYLIKEDVDSVYAKFSKDHLESIKRMRSVARAYIVLQDSRYHPSYISNHKSILDNLIDIVIEGNKKQFKSFKITCAGADSLEVRSIAKHIQETYRLIEKEEADMKIHIVKLKDVWEVGIQITPRPLSVRNYRVRNMSGAMDPTIAYAVNSFCELGKAKSYLNVFSGSATLLIEAGQCYPNLERLVGFDNNKKHLSLSVQNIKKSGLMKKVELKEINIFDKPNLGKFDAITSDLPFGMSISKGEDLEKLYQTFIDYNQEVLNIGGRLAVYTSEHEILEKIISRSRFEIIKTLELKFVTVVNAYLQPKIFVCKLRV